VEVGGTGTLAQSIKSVRMDGSISLIGVLSGAGQFDPLPLLMKSICLQGIFVGSMEMFQHMNQAIEVCQLRPIVDRVFPMQEIASALQYLASGKHFGKIVIEL
jgi:NADPH:quinone reductase-like Zn-dependent oxidoreductase